MSKSINESQSIDLQKNIELVYNQFSPTKLQAISVLNSPSERTRSNGPSIKRQFLSIGNRRTSKENEGFSSTAGKELFKLMKTGSIKNEILEDSIKNEEVESKEKNSKKNVPGEKTNSAANKNNKKDDPNEEFHNLLKLNTPKYQIFKHNNQEKFIGIDDVKKDPLGKIYQSKMLMKILMNQKRRISSSTKNIGASKFSFSKDSKTNASQTKQNFKIRKISNLSKIEEYEPKPKGNTHRKLKSTIKI